MRRKHHPDEVTQSYIGGAMSLLGTFVAMLAYPGWSIMDWIVTLVVGGFAGLIAGWIMFSNFQPKQGKPYGWTFFIIICLACLFVGFAGVHIAVRFWGFH